VTGADSPAALISICKERFPGMDWLVTDMRKLSLSRRFDAILAWDSFFIYARETNAACSPSSGGMLHQRPQLAPRRKWI